MIDININNVDKSYGFNQVLNKIYMTINKGEKVGLIGSNGSGKSTILKLIVGKELPDAGTISVRNGLTIGYLSQIPEENDIIVRDYLLIAFKDLLEMQEKLIKYENDLLSDDYKVITKYTNLQERFIEFGGYEYEATIEKITSAFNITKEMMSRNINTLSGGEKTIISLIRLLLQKPNILLLDEPTNHLDIKRIEWLEKFLNTYSGTVIIVSHDRYFMDRVVNKICLLTKRGIEVYFGNYSYFIEENERRLFIEFNDYKNQQKKIEAMEKSIKRLQEYGRLCGDAGGEIFYRRAASIKKRLEKFVLIDKPDVKKELKINFGKNSRSGNEVLKVKEFNLTIGSKELFNEANFELYLKDTACLVGDNGTGKSTLIKEILKGNPNIKIGSNVKIGYIAQELVFENENLSVIEEVRKYYIGIEENLRSVLYKFLFIGDNIYKKIKYLSGGEKVRLKILCLLQDSYNFLILDEPTNHIDIDTREMLESALKDFNGTILFVSHDRYFINKIANNILEIKSKKIIKYIGNYDYYKEKRS